jgi:4'-phosphopantetheinyl transferase EntD
LVVILQEAALAAVIPETVIPETVIPPAGPAGPGLETERLQAEATAIRDEIDDESDAAQLQADKDRFLQGQTNLGLVARP